MEISQRKDGKQNMIDLEKSKIEAEALAKLRKEQFYRETLAQELTVISDEYFKSKEPLSKILPEFAVALKDLVNTAREIFDYLEGVEPMEAETKGPFEEWAETDYPEAAKYMKASQAITAELNKDNKKTLAEMVEAQAAEETPSTAAEPDPIVAQAAEPAKLTSKQILPDEELERRYFKEGLSIPQIAKKYNLGQAGLYKRIEAIKDVKDDIEKECARRKK